MHSVESASISDISVGLNIPTLSFNDKTKVDSCMATMRSCLEGAGYTVQGLRYDITTKRDLMKNPKSPAILVITGRNDNESVGVEEVRTLLLSLFASLRKQPEDTSDNSDKLDWRTNDSLQIITRTIVPRKTVQSVETDVSAASANTVEASV